MNTFAVAAFFACLAVTNAGFYGPSANIIQGPSSKTTLVGPEGSVISAVAPGGQIIHEEHPGYIAHATPVATYAAHAPVVALTAPVALGHETHVSRYGSHITHGAPAAYAQYATPVHNILAYAAPVAYAAHSPVIAHGVDHGVADVVIAGPSGTIATTKSLVSPYHGHELYAHHY